MFRPRLLGASLNYALERIMLGGGWLLFRPRLLGASLNYALGRIMLGGGLLCKDIDIFLFQQELLGISVSVDLFVVVWSA